MTNEEAIKKFINGPLRKYLTEEMSFSRFIELINEQCETNYKYYNLYPSYLFNAKIQYPEEPDVDEDNPRIHNSTCNWFKDWHSCNCGAFDKSK